MLKQAVREMEESIAEVTEQTAKAMANEKTLGPRAAAKPGPARAVAGAGREGGRGGRRRPGPQGPGPQERAPEGRRGLEDQLGAAREASRTLKRQLAAMKAKLAEAKRNLATLSARKRAADFRKKMDTQAAGLAPEVDDNAFAKFDRLKSKVEQAEAEAEAMAELRATQVGARRRGRRGYLRRRTGRRVPSWPK